MPDDTISSDAEYRPTLTSPEGILMLAVSVIADLLGIVCLILDLAFGIGEIAHLIVDVIFTIIFGVWMIARSGTPRAGSRIGQFIKKRLFGWIGLEFVPVIGDIVPAWTIAAMQFLKENE